MYKIKYIFLCSLLLINTVNIHAKPKAKNEIILQEIDIETIKQLKNEIKELYGIFDNNYQLFKRKKKEALKFDMKINPETKTQDWKESQVAQEITFKNLQTLLILLEKSLQITHESLIIIVQNFNIKSKKENLKTFEKVRKDLKDFKENFKKEIIVNRKIYHNFENELHNYDKKLRDQGYRKITTFPEFKEKLAKLNTARKNLEATIDRSTNKLSVILFQYPLVGSNKMFKMIDKKISKKLKKNFNKESKDLKELMQEIKSFHTLLDKEEIIKFVQFFQVYSPKILIDF